MDILDTHDLVPYLQLLLQLRLASRDQSLFPRRGIPDGHARDETSPLRMLMPLGVSRQTGNPKWGFSAVPDPVWSLC